jgi:hypothetical protein
LNVIYFDEKRFENYKDEDNEIVLAVLIGREESFIFSGTATPIITRHYKISKTFCVSSQVYI